MSERPQALLFDFDGTLVDSAPSVLAALEHALRHCGVTPRVPFTPSLIGPPLRRTLATLAGSEDAGLLDQLAAAFRDEYDSRGYRLTAVYPGVPDLLGALHDAGIALYIVTNKRIKPTRLILEHLDWTRWFGGVYALDALQPAAPHKSALVREVLQRHHLAAEATWMIGDSAEDRQSALANGLRFFAATWGYGSASAGGAPEQGLSEPGALLQAVGARPGDDTPRGMDAQR